MQLTRITVSILSLSLGLGACGDGDDDRRDAGGFIRDVGAPDSGTPTDTGTTPSDMGTPPVDMGTPPVDMGTPPVDMGTPPVDMGTPPVDMGTPPADMGTPPVDMGMPPADMGMPVDMGMSADMGSPMDMGTPADMGSPMDMGAPDMGGGMDAGTGPNTSAQIAAVRARAIGASNAAVSPALSIQNAIVTYVIPTGNSDEGFFLQSAQTGPAIFVNTGMVAPTVSVGDTVSLDVTEVNDNNDFLEVTGVMNQMTVSTGANVTGLIQDISTATDTVSNLRAYESERIRVTGTLAGTQGFAGTGYVAYPMDTAGVMGNADLRFRLPSSVDMTLSPSQGCSLTASGAMWRFRADAQPQVWALSDISNVTCAISASAGSATTVIVNLGRGIDPMSVNTNGSQFTIMGLAVTQAAVSGSRVTLTTGMQTSGTMYSVQVANTVRDVTGSAISTPNNTATFSGFAPPASVVINEVYYDAPGSDGPLVFTELFGPANTDLTGWSLVAINGSNGSPYRTVMLSGTIPADGFFVVATSAATGTTLAARDLVGDIDWQNGPDAVQLVSPASTVVDALQYGSFTPIVGEGMPAPDVSGQSLSRNAAHTDTDDNSADFTAGAATPGT